jgi:ribosomal protein S18 acetylase RimI-like enzyme
MTATQAAPRPATHAKESGIRAFDIARDLRPVAELIADAFASELDERGEAALREMRVMSRLGGVLGVLNRTTSDLQNFFGGFVWVEEGKVVGNITVQRADKFGSRFQIANVAVAPPYRGRGISRKLMERALIHIREQGGRWAVLQVYAHNTVARTLYDHLGFEEVGGATDLAVDRAPAGRTSPGSIPYFRSFSPGEWQPLYELANNQLGAAAQWWRAIRRADFEQPLDQQLGEWLWRALGRRDVYRRCIQTSGNGSGHFEAALILEAQRWHGRHRLQLWVRPDSYGAWEEALIAWALATLKEYPRWPVHITVNKDHAAAQEILQRAGFRPLRTLLTMRLDVTGENSH